MKIPSGLYIDSPAAPLLQALISYWGVTTGAGNALGTTLVDALCGTAALQPSYVGLGVKILDGGAAGQVRTIMVHDLATGTLTVNAPFTDPAPAAQQIVANIRFVILSTAGGGGGAGPAPPPAEVSLWMWGACDPGMAASANIIVCTNLAGRFDDDVFNNEFWMQVVHNDNAPGVAPEREIRRITDFVGATATFTVDPFSANVEADDYVAIFHESIMGIEILGFGTLDTSSATVPADSTRAAAYAWENNDYFKGCILMPTEGNCRFQPRPIAAYAAATGVFTLDEPFSQLPGLVDYVIIRSAYPYQRLIDIFNLVNAMLVTTETGGTITTTGAAQDVYINNSPAGVFEPLKVMLDLSDMGVGDTIVVSTYYRIRPLPATKKLKDQIVFQGVQGLPLKNIELEPNRYGLAVTMECTIGGPVDVDFSVFYRV